MHITYKNAFKYLLFSALSLSCLTSMPCIAVPEALSKTPLIRKGYLVNPYVSENDWKEAEPYFLPVSHPLKAKLDKIFQAKYRVILNQESLEKAGFKHTHSRPSSHIVVAKHKKLKGYLAKIYTDTTDVNEVWRLLSRIKNAHSARETIQRLGYEGDFVVPQKWLYPLPAEPSPPKGVKRKNFILIVEQMDLIPQDSNDKRWKSSHLSKVLLEKVYRVLEAEGAADSVHVHNLPFTTEGKIALIDTEHHGHWPVNYSRLTPCLSKKNRKFWSQLTGG